MTRDELHAYAAAGVAAKIATMERELATFHKEWPELFLSATAPQLLKAATKNGSNGHWPPVVARTEKTTKPKKTKTTKKAKSRWTRPAILAGRERTVKVLNAFDTKHPIALSAVAEELGIDVQSMGIGPLVGNDYLKRKGDGFVRTAKPYVVNPFESANGK